MTKPLPTDQGLAFPNPLCTNHVVWALCTRAQRHPWVVKNRVPTSSFNLFSHLPVSMYFLEVNKKKNVLNFYPFFFHFTLCQTLENILHNIFIYTAKHCKMKIFYLYKYFTLKQTERKKSKLKQNSIVNIEANRNSAPILCGNSLQSIFT